MTEFEMSDLVVLTYFLGIEFAAMEKKFYLIKKKLCKLLEMFNILKCYPSATPTNVVVKLTAKSEDKPVDATLYK